MAQLFKDLTVTINDVTCPGLLNLSPRSLKGPQSVLWVTIRAGLINEL